MNTDKPTPLPPIPPRFNLVESLQRSRFLRVLVLGFITLLLLIPIGSIRDVIAEREQTRDSAKVEIAQQWGGAQTVMGPFLVLPYRTVREVVKDGKTVTEEAGTQYGVVLPEHLDIEAQQQSQYRQRGIFTVPVYSGSARLSGRYARPSLKAIGVPDAAIYWERAELVMVISDLRALTGGMQVKAAGQTALFEPGSGQLAMHFVTASSAIVGRGEYSPDAETTETAGTVHAALPLTAETVDFGFELPLSFNGTESLQFAPVGRVTNTHLKGDWPTPSFNGAYLPRTRELHQGSAPGFTAEWQIPDLSRSFGQVWRGEEIPYKALSAAAFGVRLYPSIDEYSMAHRAVKYAQLFIVMTFALWWLFEIIGGVRLHLLQYLLVGAGLCAFYLLQLALSEHFGFRLAYLAASAAVTVQITLYSWSALRSFKRAVGVGTAMSGLYTYLFSVLREENYALLTGAIGLFAMLSLVMWLTRRVEWSKPAQPI